MLIVPYLLRHNTQQSNMSMQVRIDTHHTQSWYRTGRANAALLDDLDSTTAFGLDLRNGGWKRHFNGDDYTELRRLTNHLAVRLLKLNT